MTREEAIKILDPETRLEYLVEVEYKAGFRGVGTVANAMKEALEMAISALREQEERSKGCEFCNTFDFKTARTEVTKYGTHVLLATADTAFPNNYQFKFCPMCGRRLEEV